MAKTSFTDTELRAEYPNAILPPSGSASDRDASGLLQDSVVRARIASLKQSGVLPSSNASSGVYDTKMKKFAKDVSKEYAFYSDRYKYALQQLFANIRSGYTANTTEAQTAVDNYVKLAETFNVKLNDCIQLIKGISDDMIQSSSTMQESLNELNTKMQGDRDRLEYQSKIIRSNDAATKIHREMVAYTEEKARYNDNLLNVYSFVNVVALGLLVYIYKAAP